MANKIQKRLEEFKSHGLKKMLHSGKFILYCEACNQQINEHFDNEKAPISESKMQNGIVINEEKSEKNGEIKQVDNEENKPYVL